MTCKYLFFKIAFIGKLMCLLFLCEYVLAKQIILKFVENPKNKTILIFSGVSIFAIQSLISIIYFSINSPHVDDWPPVTIALHYLQNDPRWIDYLFYHVNEHYLYTYRLIMMAGLLVNSFNIQQFMFVNWGFLVISASVFYMILKKTDARLVWLVIPISAFLFSPKMISVNLIASFGLQWIGTFFYLVLIVGILYKEKLSKIWFIVAISLSLIATFNTFLGLASWVIGTLILLQKRKEHKIELLVWISISIIVFSLYLSDMKFEARENSFLSVISPAGFSWGLEYVTTAFSIGFLELRILIGSITLFSLISISAYLLKKRISISYPWITIGIIGIISTIVITAGRFGIRPPYENYLIPMSLFTQISLLVLVTILFYEIRKSNKKMVRIGTIFYILFVVGQLSLFSSAYFVGYQYESEWGNEKSNWITCFDLPSNLEWCSHVMEFGTEKEYDILIEKKLNVFSNEEFFINQEQKKNDLDIKWNNLKEGSGIGNIETINDVNIPNNFSTIVNDTHVNVKGWLLGGNKIDEMYLFIDGKSFLKSSDFKPRTDIAEKFDNSHTNNIGFDVTFFSAFLEKGCHELSVGGIYDDNKFVLEKNIEICKK